MLRMLLLIATASMITACAGKQATLASADPQYCYTDERIVIDNGQTVNSKTKCGDFLTVGGGCRRREIHAGGVGHERVPVGGHDAKSIYYRGDVPLVPTSLVHDFATSDSSHALGW